MKLNISRSELKKKNKFNTNIYEENNILYKVCSDTIDREISHTLCYIHSMPKIDGFLGINDLLVDNGYIYGYTMDKLENSFTLGSVIESEFSLEEKFNLINKITNTIKEIHKYFVIGDIRLDNILIYNNEPVIIDIENGQKLKTRKYLVTYYSLRDKKNSIMDDIFKLFVCTLSILLNTNLEELFVCENGNYLDECVYNLGCNEIICYYEYLKDALNEDYINPIYFTDIFENFNIECIKNILDSNGLIRKKTI